MSDPRGPLNEWEQIDFLNLTDKNITNIREIQEKIYKQSVFKDWHTSEFNLFEAGTKIALIHSEISEALEGVRKDLMDNHLPHRKMVEVELADAIIRILDLAGWLDLDIGMALAEKHQYNRYRSNHKMENRIKKGGKKF